MVYDYSLIADDVGASYPIGGASEIPYRIVPVIERAGGRVLMKAPVTEILTDYGQVYGVRVGKPGNTVDIHAPIVISDAGIDPLTYVLHYGLNRALTHDENIDWCRDS